MEDAAPTPEARDQAWTVAEVQVEAEQMDEREAIRLQLEAADTKAKLAELLDKHKALIEDHEKEKRINKSRRKTLAAQAERIYRVLMALVVAVILAAFSSMPAARELAWTIVKSVVAQK